MRKVLSLFVFLVIVSCEKDGGNNNSFVSPDAEFNSRYLEANETGIDFANNLRETDEVNRLTYEYFYNGGGVAAGDINNDGLPDLYFTGNMVPDRLYLNKGGLSFEDITNSSGISFENDWHTGVTMVDINQDGWLDIYVCRSGWYKDRSLLKNRLYINQNGKYFREAAAEYGLDDDGFSVQAVFFDADRDGDLDAYVLNNPEQKPDTKDYEAYMLGVRGGSYTTDRFYLQEEGTFVDRTKEWGFTNFGFRHGVAVGDFNNDAFPDLYISSDFDDPDYLYINNAGSGFENRIRDYTNHITMFSMGCDIGDINRDGWMDLMVVDMTPADHERSKQNMASMQPEKFAALVEHGFHHQYMANSLQLNTGMERFIDIANMAGVAYTDWSWATLFLDWDMDGWEDVFVSNGIKRDVLNNDVRLQTAQLVRRQGSIRPTEVLDLMPANKLKNQFFRNTGNLTFTKDEDELIEAPARNTNGVAYADLDNDGDLDLILNNVDDQAGIIENGSADSKRNNFLVVALKGKPGNISGTGAKVIINRGGNEQMRFVQPTRGFNSSVDNRLFFGLGERDSVSGVKVLWPDGREQVVEEVAINTQIEIRYDPGDYASKDRSVALLERVDTKVFRHKESRYNDFTLEVLLPHKQSTHGPCTAVADIDGNGTMDVFVGGAAAQAGVLLVQDPGGALRPLSGPWAMHAYGEDVAAHFFDKDGDGDQDLYVGRGSNEFDKLGKGTLDVIYENKGGVFELFAELQEFNTNTSAVTSGDIDGDGDLDLFIGARNQLRRYPLPAKSFVLKNEGGVFVDAGIEFEQGMINDAVFIDADGDGDQDLLTAGEWTDLVLYRNDNGQLRLDSTWKDRKLNGWWQSLEAVDVDADGDLDILAGNIGLNNKFHPTADKALKLYANDFDENGTMDLVLSKKYKGRYVPVRGRECSSEQMPFIAEKFPTYRGFAEASLEEIIGDESFSGAMELEAREFGHVLIRNDGGKYQTELLPMGAQTGPIKDFCIDDVNGDGYEDILAVGNHYGSEVETVRYDALGSVLLLGSADGFRFLNPHESGLDCFLNTRSVIKLGNGRYLIASNDEELSIYERTGSGYK